MAENDFASFENLNCNDENLLGQHIKDLLSETEIDYERNEDSEDDSYINEEKGFLTNDISNLVSFLIEEEERIVNFKGNENDTYNMDMF